MNELKTFNNEEFGLIRTVDVDNEPWFVGKDVAVALGYANPRKALIDHVDDMDKGVTKCDTLGGKQGLTIVNESGLYALIFGSKLDSAKRFKRWVTSEVLPALRRTGKYEVKNLSKEMRAILMHDEKIVKMENRIEKLEFDIPLYGSEADELSGHVRRKGVEVLGGKKSEAYADKKLRSRVYADIYDQIKREFGIYSDGGIKKTYKHLKRKYINDAHRLIDEYRLPHHMEQEISDANAQLSF